MKTYTIDRRWTWQRGPGETEVEVFELIGMWILKFVVYVILPISFIFFVMIGNIFADLGIWKGIVCVCLMFVLGCLPSLSMHVIGGSRLRFFKLKQKYPVTRLFKFCYYAKYLGFIGFLMILIKAHVLKSIERGDYTPNFYYSINSFLSVEITYVIGMPFFAIGVLSFFYSVVKDTTR